MAKHLVLVLVILSGCSGAEPPARSVEPATTESTTESAAEPRSEEPAPPAELAREDFLFQWRRASGPAFVDQLSIRGDGQLIWVAQVVRGHRGTMHAVELRADDAEVAGLRRVLAEARFFELASCPPSGVSDGASLLVQVREGERVHRVSCEEAPSAEVERIRATVEGLLTPARRAELERSPEAVPEDFDPSLVE